MITYLLGVIQGKHPATVRRSSKWGTTRKQHLTTYPACVVCGGVGKGVEVHHIVPFHIRPDLELDPNNLITLCESGANGINCHLAVGHRGSYKSFNVNVRIDALRVASFFKHRP